MTDTENLLEMLEDVLDVEPLFWNDRDDPDDEYENVYVDDLEGFGGATVRHQYYKDRFYARVYLGLNDLNEHEMELFLDLLKRFKDSGKLEILSYTKK